MSAQTSFSFLGLTSSFILLNPMLALLNKERNKKCASRIQERMK